MIQNLCKSFFACFFLGALSFLQAQPVPNHLIKGGASSFYPATEIQTAPDLSFSSQAGTTTLSNFQGQVVILNFWATWCVPCRREMPDLVQLQSDLGSEGLVVVAVSQDKNISDVDLFYSDYGITLDKYINRSGNLQKSFNLTGLPASVIIDRNGIIVGDFQGFIDWSDPDVRALLDFVLLQK
tara:strand:- start:2186 stop:2734 length:549 start_codon:yes stop_codon:yes gene_type:complete